MTEGEGVAAESGQVMADFLEAVRLMRVAQITNRKARGSLVEPQANQAAIVAEAIVDTYLRPESKANDKQPEMF